MAMFGLCEDTYPVQKHEMFLFLENHYDLCYTECDAVVTNQK